MRWFEQLQLGDMVLSARAECRHPGYVALQPIIDVLESIMGRFKKGARSSFPPRA